MANADLQNKLLDIQKKIFIGSLYYHYLTKRWFKVIDIGLDKETKEPIVIYKILYDKDNIIWVSKFDVWFGQVEHRSRILAMI